jgi:16S rRNA processing protein RimM
MSSSETFVPVGKISGAFGVKGWVKVYSYTEPRANILQYSPIYMSRHGEWVEVKVQGGHMQGKGVVMGLANITDRDQVLALMGSELAIKKSQLKPADEDEFYWTDLMGLEVVNLKGDVLGQVDHMMETGANDVLVVKGKGQKVLIPFVLDHVIKQVDLETKHIQVDWEADY